MIHNIADFRNRPEVGSRVYWKGDLCNRPHRYEVTRLEGHYMHLRDLDDGSTTYTPVAILEEPTRWTRECPNTPVTVEDPPDPYERSYGARAKETEGLSRAQIASLIRSDIRAAVKRGELPRYRYNVRTRQCSGGGAIDVTVTLPPGIKSRETDEYGRSRYTDEAKQIEERIDAITWAYNYDGSNSQIDYFDRRFYGSVDFEGCEATP